jgi:hypothetical protein
MLPKKRFLVISVNMNLNKRVLVVVFLTLGGGGDVYSQWGLIPRPLGRFELATPNKKWY